MNAQKSRQTERMERKNELITIEEIEYETSLTASNCNARQ